MTHSLNSLVSSFPPFLTFIALFLATLHHRQPPLFVTVLTGTNDRTVPVQFVTIDIKNYCMINASF